MLIMSGALYLCECCCFSCNKCCKCPLPGCQLCLKSVYGVVSHTDLSVVCAQKGSFTAPRSLVLLRRAFPAPPPRFRSLCHIFFLVLLQILSVQNSELPEIYRCAMDCPCRCAQDSRFFTRLCLNFLCSFTATVVAVITITNLGAIPVPSTRG